MNIKGNLQEKFFFPKATLLFMNLITFEFPFLSTSTLISTSPLWVDGETVAKKKKYLDTSGLKRKATTVFLVAC